MLSAIDLRHSTPASEVRVFEEFQTAHSTLAGFFQCSEREETKNEFDIAGPGLSQLDQLLPIGPRVWFYRPWWKLTGNLGRPKLGPWLILQTLVQVHWEPGPTEIVPNWAPRLILQSLVEIDW